MCFSFDPVLFREMVTGQDRTTSWQYGIPQAVRGLLRPRWFTVFNQKNGIEGGGLAIRHAVRGAVSSSPSADPL